MKSRYSMLQKKKRKWPYIVSGSILGVLIVAVVGWIWWNDWDIDKSIASLGISLKTEESVPVEEKPVEEPVEEEPVVETPTVVEPEVDMSGAKGYVGNETLPEEPTYVEGILIASKKYPLPSTYAPGESKEARAAFEEMPWFVHITSNSFFSIWIAHDKTIFMGVGSHPFASFCFSEALSSKMLFKMLFSYIESKSCLMFRISRSSAISIGCLLTIVTYILFI